jgi:hypothetical protein
MVKLLEMLLEKMCGVLGVAREVVRRWATQSQTVIRQTKRI